MTFCLPVGAFAGFDGRLSDKTFLAPLALAAFGVGCGAGALSAGCDCDVSAFSEAVAFTFFLAVVFFRFNRPIGLLKKRHHDAAVPSGNSRVAFFAVDY